MRRRSSSRLIRALPILAATTIASPPQRAAAQDPVTKPTTTTTITRLPAPTGVSARQQGDGRILLAWHPVEGAVKYQITRSVPPAGAVVLATAPTDTFFIDSDVKVGSTYYYLVGAYNGAGTLGLKAGSVPVTATIALGGTTATSTVLAPPTIGRAVLGPTDTAASVSWTLTQPPIDVVVLMDRGVASSAGGTPTFVGVASSIVKAGSGLSITRVDYFGRLPAGTIVVYRLRTVSATNNAVQSAPVLTSRLVIPTTTTTTTLSDTGGGGAGGGTGSVLVTMASPASVAVGATTSLASSTGISGARWTSLNETIATVDASGTITGRSGGSAQIVALSTTSDGSVRVTVMRVTVTP